MESIEDLPKIPKNIIKSSGFQCSELLVTEDKASFVFIIKNYSLLNKVNGEFILSPDFCMEKNKDIKWNLRIYPKGQTKDCEDCLSIFLHHNLQSLSAIKLEGEFALLGVDNQIYKTLEISHTFEAGKGWGYPTFLRKEEFLVKDKFLRNDTLTVICTFVGGTNFSTKTKLVQVTNNERRPEKELKTELLSISKNCEKMFGNDSYSDITFIVEGKKLKAHKCLLSVSSPVLASIFKKDNKNKEINTIEIADITYQIMFEMLRFIYIQKVENLKDIAHELISAAVKYAITDLKNLCEKELCDNVNADNVLKMVIIADANDAKELKELAFNTIVQNRKELSTKPEFKEMLEARPNLLEELFWFMALKDTQ